MAQPTSVSPVTTAKAAEYMTKNGYAVSKATVVRLVASGSIPAFRTAGGHARIRISDLDKFIAARA